MQVKTTSLKSLFRWFRSIDSGCHVSGLWACRVELRNHLRALARKWLSTTGGCCVFTVESCGGSRGDASTGNASRILPELLPYSANGKVGLPWFRLDLRLNGRGLNKKILVFGASSVSLTSRCGNPSTEWMRHGPVVILYSRLSWYACKDTSKTGDGGG